MGETRIGISGWTYPPWRGRFYPKGWPQNRELEYASRQVSSIEINGSFYSLQRPESYGAWYDASPEGFVFSIKGSRFITHLKRLKDVETPLANFFASGVLRLEEKLGPFLWQLPPSFVSIQSDYGSSLTCCPVTPAQRLNWRRSTMSGWKVGSGRRLTGRARSLLLIEAQQAPFVPFAGGRYDMQAVAPVVKEKAWAKTKIDGFVLHELEAKTPA